MDVNDLARELDAWRPAELNQSEWARRAGYTPSQVSNFLNYGSNITVRAMLALAEALGVRPTFVPLEVASDADLIAATKRLSPWSSDLLRAAVSALLSEDPLSRARAEGALAAVLGVPLPVDEAKAGASPLSVKGG